MNASRNGVNAFRNGMDERSSEEKKDGSNPLSSVLHTRDPYMCHAEVNAIVSARGSYDQD